MNILVTGGAGYVGSAAVRLLLSRGHHVAVLDDLTCGHVESIPRSCLTVGRIDDRKKLEEIIRREECEAVLHFAGSALVGESVANPRLYYANNVSGSLVLLESLMDCGIKSIVFSSTCAVYGEINEMPLTEDSQVQPVSPYAFTKHAIERMIGDFARAYGVRYALLRYFNAAGGSDGGRYGEDHDPETHLIPILLGNIMGIRARVQVFGNDYPTPDGTCIRDYVHVDDLAEAHLLALEWVKTRESGKGAAFNLGSGVGNSVLQVIAAVERVTGRRVSWEVSERRPGDAAVLVAAPNRARAVLRWRPEHMELDDIVASAWEWHRDRPNGYRRLD